MVTKTHLRDKINYAKMELSSRISALHIRARGEYYNNI